MQFRKDKYGKELSILGYGCMRFTKKGGVIDINKAEKEIMAAYNAGVNYYDTAYIYPGSEAVLGEILERNKIRKDVNIATKLPQYLIRDKNAIDRYFKEELSRLRTDYIDYYLMHHLTDIEMWEKLKRIGIEDWIKQKKENGQIHNIGFSYHGNSDGFVNILNSYDWDFCMMQYNYLDEVSQAGVVGLKAAAKKEIPVIIMEPLRGGKLVNMLPEKAKKLFAESEHGKKRGWTPAEWAFRWLYNQPEITAVLSGMNSLEMVEENVRIANEVKAGMFEQSDFNLLKEVTAAIKENERIGCTGCRYCMPCPRGVDIPGIFGCWNTMYTEKKKSGRLQFFQTVAFTKEPSFATQCRGCGICEKHCPQNLPIIKKLKEADKDLRPLPFKIVIDLARKLMYHSL